MDLILFEQTSCVFTIYSYQHTAASLLRSPCRVLRLARHTERFAKRSCTNAAAQAHINVSPFARICSLLGRHIFTARKRLQKQGPKAIGTKTCFARTHTYMRASPHGSHSACTDMLVRAVCCERTYTCPFFGSTHGSHSACTGMLVRSNCLALFSFLGGLPEDYFLIAQAQKVTVAWRTHTSLTFPQSRAQNLVTDLLPSQIANPKRARCWGTI